LRARLLSVSLSLVLLATQAEGAGGRRRVLDSILGVRIGASSADASRRLDRLADRRPEERAEHEEEERGEDRKMAWSLKATEYKSVVLSVNDENRIVWITAFVRPGREIAFSKLGDLSVARVSDSTAIWNVSTPDGGYQLVARGRSGKANVVSLLSFARD
jgi:hypothetical protein